MGILDQIVAAKINEVAVKKARLSADILAARCEAIGRRAAGSFLAALSQGQKPRVIAEVKRASPSRGVLRPALPLHEWSAASLAKAYDAGGACALSVLTDVNYFWGDPNALGYVEKVCSLPKLRKDFILEPYQVDESYWLGADAILLIARILSEADLIQCGIRARELGMDVLVEVHEAAEIDVALKCEGAIIGINHRDLQTMEIDMQRARSLRSLVPTSRCVVAESGISKAAEVGTLLDEGFENFLIGSHLAAAGDPQGALEALRQPWI